MNPNQFVDKWEKVELKERASAQSHFEDVCRLVGHPLPAERDPRGVEFTYEYGVEKSGGGKGFADVWFDDHFAIEYKGKGKYADLGGAYQQLLRYRENLKNPPLLVVCDIENWEIHTNWPGTEKKVYRFNNRDLLNPTHLERVRNLFYAPERLHPRRNTEEVTADAAEVFKTITDNMRQWQAEPERIAHFMTKLVFCLFAEDVGLLPTAPHSEAGVFSEIVEQTRAEPSKFVKYARDLFTAMADGGEFMFKTIPYFNGALFEDVQVEELAYEALNQLAKAARLNWRSIEPSIFGTLFERSLDPSKRAQLGAHYTSRDDILLIVEPVLMQPLRREWAALQAEAVPLRDQFDAAQNERAKVQSQQSLLARRDQMLTRLRTIKVLDPACGSGNFLYVALGLLLDLEKEVINHPLFAGLPSVEPGVHPRQLYGIEINPIAHALASIVVWIGYIQWRQNNGYWGHSTPILEALHDNIRLMDAILAFDADGHPIEPDWPAVEVIVGNPPFLGGSLIRGELGDAYIEKLWALYDGRVPGFSDLVCYWFERARAEIQHGKAKRAGLLATNSIRGGVNRRVLERIKASGDIFMAWSDREWVLDGAAVRVSMVGFKGSPSAQTVPSQPDGWVHTYAQPVTYDKIQPAVRELRNEPTLAEKTLWEHIRKNKVGGYKFRRQHPINRFIVDFYCPEARLAIELDGPIHDQQQGYDQARQEHLERLGVRVLRFKNDDVLENVQGAVEVIYEALQQGNVPTPNPLSTPAENVPTPNPSPTHWGGEQDPADEDLPPFPVATGKGLGDGDAITLDGLPVATINPDLTGGVDITKAARLGENTGISFIGPQKDGPLDIPNELAQKILESVNPSGKGNADVLKPYLNGSDLVQISRNYWIIDYGTRSIEEASQYEAPFKYVEENLKPLRANNRDIQRRTNWWRLGRSGGDYRSAVQSLSRQIFTPRVAKHRVFVWVGVNSFPDSAVVAIARQDDYFFGVLHSKLHEVWSLRMGTSLEDRPRYTPTTTFETFPFPFVPGQEPTADPRYQAIAAAAQQLDAERSAWLNPPNVSGKSLQERTLTNLYNALNVYRGVEKIATKKAAGDFAPRLDELHQALDAAVCAAYGWDTAILTDEEEILRRLLSLNLERAGG